MISPFSARQVACPTCCAPFNAEPLNVQSGTNVRAACPLRPIEAAPTAAIVRNSPPVRRCIDAPDRAIRATCCRRPGLKTPAPHETARPDPHNVAPGSSDPGATCRTAALLPWERERDVAMRPGWFRRRAARAAAFRAANLAWSRRRRHEHHVLPPLVLVHRRNADGLPCGLAFPQDLSGIDIVGARPAVLAVLEQQ